ncbi:outer membrane protein [Mesorhizobium shangrilense]|uniref:Outer membrane protein n=1 Tax=Mesorhizobium shangrilense TaxID=460060 RepID=A0ABV2D708_9HYPH
MKTILLASTFLLAASGAALAADAVLTERIPEPAPAAFTWTGAYIGVQGGYAWTHGQLDINQETYFDGNLNGALLGAHAGYNWQPGDNFVGGIEVDVEHVWNTRDFVGGDGVETHVAGDIGTDWQGSARLRGGYAVERTLFFATGGVAMAHGFLNLPGPDYHQSKTFVGWTAGAGIEHAFTDHWTGRLEYRYADFGSQSFPQDVVFGFKQHSLRAGISYKF